MIPLTGKNGHPTTLAPNPKDGREAGFPHTARGKPGFGRQDGLAVLVKERGCIGPRTGLTCPEVNRKSEKM